MARKPIRRLGIEATVGDVCAVVSTTLLITVLFTAYFGTEGDTTALPLTQTATPTHSLIAW